MSYRNRSVVTTCWCQIGVGCHNDRKRRVMNTSGLNKNTSGQRMKVFPNKRKLLKRNWIEAACARSECVTNCGGLWKQLVKNVGRNWGGLQKTGGLWKHVRLYQKKKRWMPRWPWYTQVCILSEECACVRACALGLTVVRADSGVGSERSSYSPEWTIPASCSPLPPYSFLKYTHTHTE